MMYTKEKESNQFQMEAHVNPLSLKMEIPF